MSKENINIVRKANIILNSFNNSLDTLIASANNRTIVITNSAKDLSVSMGYFNDKDIFTLKLENINEDVYNYIISSIYMRVRDMENAQIATLKAFDVEVTGNNYNIFLSFKGPQIFIFNGFYDKKKKYIEMLKNDMTSRDFVNPWSIEEQISINNARTADIRNYRLGK